MPMPPAGIKRPSPYPVDHNIKRGPDAKYPFQKTQIGENFTVKMGNTMRSSLQQLCYRYSKNLGRKFTLRDKPETGEFIVECFELDGPREEIVVNTGSAAKQAARLQRGQSFSFTRPRVHPELQVSDRFSLQMDDDTFTLTRVK